MTTTPPTSGDVPSLELRVFPWLAGLVLAIAGLYPLRNTDGYGHLAQGRNIAELGHVPSLDPFSFWKATPQPWHNYEWGYDLLSWKVYDSLGPNGLLFAKCFVLFLVGVLLVRTAAKLSSDPRTASWLALVVLIIVAPSTRFRLSERPHVLGFLFAAALLLGLAELSRRKDKQRWMIVAALAVMHVVWINCHGSHLLGLLITGAHALFAWKNRSLRVFLFVLLALQGAAAGISPFGFSILTDAIEHTTRSEYRGVVTEWTAWSTSEPPEFLITIMLQSVLVLLGARTLARGGMATRANLVCALGMAFMAFRSLRFIAEYLLLATPAVAAGLAPRCAAVRGSLRVAIPIAASAAAIWVSQVVPPEVKFGIGESGFLVPQASGDFLREHVPHARIFATVQDSWYLLFKAPQAKVLFDGRAPFYRPEHIHKLERAQEDPRYFRQLVDGYGVDTIVLSSSAPAMQMVTRTVQSWPDWHLVFVEERYAVFVAPARLAAPPPSLAVLPATYDPTPILDPATPASTVWADLNKLGKYDNGTGYRAWVKGLLELKPLVRDGVYAGVRAPKTEAEREQARKALAWLRIAAKRVPFLQTVEIAHAMAALSACKLDEAHAALESARAEGGGEDRRETLLLDKEVALRRGDEQATHAFLEWATRQPGVDADPFLSRWLPAIRADLDHGIRCK